MIERNRRGLTAEQKAELWKRWKAGQSLHAIGRALGKDHVVVHFVLARHGGGSRDTLVRERVSVAKLGAACLGHSVSLRTLGLLG